MIKTSYQTPELRDANDNVVQEGAFGKNTALSNSTNDGWIDYVVNNLEALHDTIGDSAATLDGNGHVVEPANLAIGDEDGNRLKTSYLKLTGGTVAGTLNVQQNLKFQDNQENVFGGVYIPSSSATEQYAQFYGGESTGVAGAKLTLYPDGDGRFKLEARSTDGANTYTLVTDNNGNLNWRGYPLAWKKDYLPLAGGTMTGWLSANQTEFRLRNIKPEHDGMISLVGGEGTLTGANLYLYGVSNGSRPGRFELAATDGTTSYTLRGLPNGTLTWMAKNIERIESSGTNYIRYVSGLQVCWGLNSSGNGEARTISFPVAYSAAPVVVASPRPNSISTTSFPVYMVRVSNVSTTSFDIAVSDATNIQAWLASWIAIGYWK